MAVNKFSDEQGSISVLIMGLFAVAVALLILITDLASIAVSRQSLTHVSEAAAIRAVHSVDLGAYYRGGSGVAVPIDCGEAFRAANDELSLWIGGDAKIRRRELQEVSLHNFGCSGNRVNLSVSARVLLPFRLPQGSPSVEIRTTVEARSEQIP